ncbi:TetR family transcriptional regulator [Rhodobacteraceae bacterium 4F10]|nr:TetR family transcriptional regulator [Rhodobacteraceae bacterium 4F10]
MQVPTLIRLDCSPSKGEVTRQKIKMAAMKLFAQRGLEAVSVRDINKASGQRNAGSINYHFSSRDDLIREIMLDVGKILDADHAARLDELEAQSGPKDVREVASILVRPLSEISDDITTCTHSLRFLHMAMLSHRDMMMDALENRPGLERCLDHIRRLAPEMPTEILEQRIRLAMKFLLMSGSAREQALQHGDNYDPYWNAPWAPDNVADAFAGIVSAPVSKLTQDLFDGSQDSTAVAS